MGFGLGSMRCGGFAAVFVLALGACGGGGAETPADDACESETCGEESSSSTTDGPAGSTGEDPAGSSSGGEVASGDVPCEVAAILSAHCGECHAAPPAFGAPMSLVEIEDFLVPSVTDPARAVAELTLERVDDTERPMPPDNSLSDEDKAVLTDWIDAGMPPNEGAACEDEPDEPDEPIGPDALPCEPAAEFRAFADGTQTEPFAVPDVDDLYMCFVFDSPFGDITQGTAWAPDIDDERVVHHWLLLKTDNPDYVPGTAFPCGNDVTLETQMLMGWAPGTNNFVMPEEAGLELPAPGERVVLQIHYNNTAGYDDALDQSGVVLCTTEEPRPNLASTLWLGTTEIEVPPGERVTTTGNCNTGVRATEPFKMLLSWPHMHEFGEAIRTEIIRGGTGDPEMLTDVPEWNFENQVYYPYEPAIDVTPGDILRTSCEFHNDTDQTVTFGEGTGDEMCFDFALVYPITAFDIENPFGPPELGRYCVGLGGSGFP